MKKLEKPFSDYWYPKQTKKVPKLKLEIQSVASEDEEYHAFKRVIQQEAVRKWRNN